MGKAIKILSIVLIAASLFGLVGGSMSLKDALGSKAYWENASGGGDSIGMLEDGLKQLQANEAAYLEGRDALNAGKEAYAEGVKALEEGQAQYDEGAKTLEEKQAEYDAGVAALADAEKQLEDGGIKLNDGEKKYAAGEAALEQAKALQAGLGQIVSGFGTWKQGYQGLQQFQASAGLPAPAADNTATYDAAIEAAKTQVASGLGYCDQLDTLKSQKSQLEAALDGKPSKADLEAALAAAGNPSLETLQGNKTALESAIASAKAADPAADTSALEAQLATVASGIAAYAGIEAYNNLDAVNGGISMIEAGLGGQTRESLNATKASLDQLTGVPKAVADGQKTLAAGLSTAVNGALGNEDMAKELTSKSGMSADQLKATVAALSGMDYATFNATMTSLTQLVSAVAPQLAKTISDGEKALADARKELDEGLHTYRKGYEQYKDGKKQLEEGAVLLEEGKATLEAAGKQLEEGKAQLADAEKQIADGEAQLAAFEDGRDQVIAGLETAIATEAFEGTESIAERLGENFSYMKNDTDLDIDKGFEVVAAARAYAADTVGAVTKEITGKAVSSIVAIAGSALALLGGILGLALKKPGFAGVVSLLGGAAAVVGAVMSITAGSFFSQAAGASGPALLTAAEAVTAVAAVPHAISAFTAKAKAAR